MSFDNDTDGDQPSIMNMIMMVRYTLVGGPDSPWSSMIWSLMFSVCVLYALYEAIKEATRCIAEMFPYGESTTTADEIFRDKYAIGRPRPLLCTIGIFRWFGSAQSTPRSVIIFEIILRVLFVFICGLFNGAVSFMVIIFFVPAFIWYGFHRLRYKATIDMFADMEEKACDDEVYSSLDDEGDDDDDDDEYGSDN